MCLVVVAWQSLPGVSLAAAGNRDEFYGRPTRRLHWWDKDILAGRDMQALGTWMGTNKQGRFAVVTNFRDPHNNTVPAQSRGQLITDFLTSSVSLTDFDQTLKETGGSYAGFNLIYGDRERLHYFSNQQPQPVSLTPGVYGLSNHLLDTPWPKLVKARESLKTSRFQQSAVLATFEDTEPPLGELPNTGVGMELEQELGRVFVRTPQYGTRATSLITVADSGTVYFFERSFDADGGRIYDTSFNFELS